MAVEAKKLRYAVDLASTGELTDEDGVAIDVTDGWSPEHLLLAALVRCSLKSLRYHAERKGVDLRSVAGSSRTLVTRRDKDDLFALVQTDVELAVKLEPEPAALAELLALAERHCFVGSSLTAKPSYRWVVNGRTAGS